MPICRLVCLVLLTLILSACEFLTSSEQPTPTVVSTAVPLPTETQNESETPEPALVLLPSPTPLSVTQPLPTPTHNAELADWTMMIYVDADNNLELSSLLDINEMELAGQSDQVNVIVQIDRSVDETQLDGDWSEARRYRILSDADTLTINSELVQNLGEINMGDPQVLADFLQWGMSAYPANRYALLLWDHGAGWQGVAFDEGMPFEERIDHLSLQDLELALTQGLQNQQLDLIGFDACLMGQLDVLNKIRPFAHVAVASEELIPGDGWDYEALLSGLYANPTVDGAQLGTQMVNSYLDYYTHIKPDDFVTLSAIDLQALPELTFHVENFAAELANHPDEALGAVGDARTGVESFARVYAQESDHYAAIDLGHFASIIAQRSSDKAIVAAANGVNNALANAVIANGVGAGLLNSQGVALYFPRHAALYDASYAEMSSLPTWNQFLNNYHASAEKVNNSPPAINLYNVVDDVVGVQNPAFLEFQIIGQHIEEVSIFAVQVAGNGRNRLVEFDRLIPKPTILPDGSEIMQWRDGVHDDFYIWDTEVTYIYDVFGNEDIVVMWPTEPGSTLFTVQGEFRRAGETEGVAAHLVFDHRTGELQRVWAVQSNESKAPAEIFPFTGDEFQLTDFYQEKNALLMQPGTTFVFNEDGQLFFEWRPLLNGNYEFGIEAENIAGAKSSETVPLTVNNDQIIAGYSAYLDPYLGYQFNYPTDWYRPRYEQGLLYTTDPSGTMQLLVTAYPNIDANVTAESLKAETLTQFGDVSLLYEAPLAIGSVNALQTAYGYTDGNERAHSGIFYTFVHPNGTGYVVDVDGLTENEQLMVDTAVSLTESWQFIDAGIGPQPGRWPTLDLDGFSVAQPANFIYQKAGDWERFSSGSEAFAALRVMPETLPATDVLDALIRDASAGIDDFHTTQERVTFPLDDKVWTRTNFAYTNSSGKPISGFIMVRVQNGQEVVAWAEALASDAEIETAVFLPMIADLALK